MRACEAGTVMFGLRPERTKAPAATDLVWPSRRTYTLSHLDHVIEVVTRAAPVARHAHRVPAKAATASSGRS